MSQRLYATQSKHQALLLKALAILSLTLTASRGFADIQCSRFFSVYRNRAIEFNTYHVFDHKGFYFKARYELGVVSMSISLRDSNTGARSKILGHRAFENMMEHFGPEDVHIIKGRWIFGTSANYAVFHGARSMGLSMEKAAFSTWTGSQAKKHGYEIVKVNSEWAKMGEEIIKINGYPVEIIKADFYRENPRDKSEIEEPKISASLEVMK